MVLPRQPKPFGNFTNGYRLPPCLDCGERLLKFKLEVIIQFQTFVGVSEHLGERLNNDLSDKSLEFVNS